MVVAAEAVAQMAADVPHHPEVESVETLESVESLESLETSLQPSVSSQWGRIPRVSLAWRPPCGWTAEAS